MTWKSLLYVLALTSLANAQPVPMPKDGKVNIAILTSPAEARKPASKYYLIPEYSELLPGSKVQGFLTCFMEADVFFGRDATLQRQQFLDMPFANLPKNVREQCGIHGGMGYNPPYANMMVRIDQAARYNHTEWNEWFGLRKDGLNYLLSEVQRLRSLASVLKLRMRGEIKNGEFGRAIVTVRSLTGLAKAFEEHPTLIGNLVGIAIATDAINGLEEMIQQPDCPNLYWSFVDLPKPLLSFRQGLSGERLFITARMNRIISDRRPYSDTELTEIINLIKELVELEGYNLNIVEKILSQPKVFYATQAADEKTVEAARSRIVESGIPASIVKTFPPLQVVIHDDILQYEIKRDELFKWANLPWYQAQPGFESANEILRGEKLSQLLGPSMIKRIDRVLEAGARLDQRIAYLRTIEAIRLHAFDNNGQLPAQLSDIKLPLCDDPITGKPFNYSVSEGTATLYGENPSRGNARTNRVYTITLRK